ncbi:extracellular solute-binding protein [Microbacterium pumilum]|uniref:Extracellular solute-binding protein n=2 Tax=Microbacterium pumilum TaxID=344165 RepID=A0ABP5EGK8_9MICO
MPESNRPLDRYRPLGLLVATGVVSVLALAGCAAPGSSAPDSTETPSDVSAELTSDDVVVSMLLESGGAPAVKSLAAEFTKQHPNVTFDIKEDNFQNLTANAAKIIASPDAPDLVRYPNVAEQAKNGTITNLDAYAAAFGWDDWPQSLLGQMRVNDDGTRGAGSLYGMGIGFNVTGVYYNKKLAEQIGMTTPPETLDDFVALLDDAVAAGLTPMSMGNKGWNASFPLQGIQNQLPGVDDLRDWIYQVPDATYETDSAVEAATMLQDWNNKGYFLPDVNAIDYPTMVSTFAEGKAVFILDGDWNNAAYDGAGGTDTFGFFPFPPVTADGSLVAMASPSTYVLPKSAKNAATTAYFLNWVATDPEAREIVVTQAGSNPGGPTDLELPTIDPSSLASLTLPFGTEVSDQGGAMDFIANATAGIWPTTIGPNSQLLLANKMTPDEFVASVQKQYETELGR